MTLVDQHYLKGEESQQTTKLLTSMGKPCLLVPNSKGIPNNTAKFLAPIWNVVKQEIPTNLLEVPYINGAPCNPMTEEVDMRFMDVETDGE